MDIAQGLNAFAGARVGGDDHGQIILLSNSVEEGDNLLQIGREVNIFFAMTTDNKVLALLKVELRQDVRGLNLVHVLHQDFVHWRTCHVNVAMGQAFAQEVAARVLGVDQVEVGDMVNDAAVNLFWHIEVKGTVSRLHVVDWNLHALGHNASDCRIGVTQDEHGVGLFLQEDLFHADQGFAQDVAQGGGVHIEVVVRLAQPKVFKEDLVEFVIVVLTRVHHLVIHVGF